MSKYEPLREHLARLDDVVWAAKLDDVEVILGANLPKSAREHRTWWANSGRGLVHQNAWLDAGWRVERTDLKRNVVVFRRLRIGGTVLAAREMAERPSRSDGRSDTEKRLAGIVSGLRQPVTVTLRAEWTAIGNVHKVPCSGSVIPKGPGILRVITLWNDEPQLRLLPTESIHKTYRDLRMAMTQTDNDVASKLLAAFDVKRDAPLECDVIKPGNAWLLTDGRGRKADLEDGPERDLVAQLLYVQEIQSGHSAKVLTV